MKNNVIFLQLLAFLSRRTDAFSSLPLFQKPITIRPTLGKDPDLVQAGKVFTQAFWNGKVGGTKEMTLYQATSLERLQISEFQRRYGRRSTMDRQCELFVGCNSEQKILGCVGIELDFVPSSAGGMKVAPLMSNLAVAKLFRKRGLAQRLVKAAEKFARTQWGYDECYLYVEKRNVPAVKLYKKLGYRVVREDKKAVTLVPTDNGRVQSVGTVLLCMRKQLNGDGWLKQLFTIGT